MTISCLLDSVVLATEEAKNLHKRLPPPRPSPSLAPLYNFLFAGLVKLWVPLITFFYLFYCDHFSLHLSSPSLIVLYFWIFRRPVEVAGDVMLSTEIVPAGNGVEGRRYPPPLASHEDVVRDPTLFWDTLRNFNSELGTKHMVPVIGGKELNLHVLYVEVTRRGGYDKVVSEKKWREISSVFEFSPTTTSASYALRKHYFTLLHRYEQVYFFKLQGPLTMPTATGTIDGKCDCGYLVSVKLGSEILNGVLYFPDQPSSSSLSATQPCTAIVPYAPKPCRSDQRNRRRRRRRKRGGGDPSRPKPNRSGYNFFFAEKHSALKSIYPDREREFTKMIGESWNNLNQEERMVYQNYGLKDKERYQREMKEYKERINLTQQNQAHRAEYYV